MADWGSTTSLADIATELAGNREVKHSETIFVDQTLTCAGPTPAFSLPNHGTLLINDRVLPFD